mgnify:CR=1 FL=1
MHYRLLYSLLLCLCISKTAAQTPQTASKKGGALYYYLVFNAEKESKLIFAPEDRFVLYFDQQRSYSFAKASNRTDSLGGGNTIERIGGFLAWYKDFATGELIEVLEAEGFGKNVVADKIVNIQWSINHDKRKKIADLDCIQAEGRFRGRDYRVWYAQSVPLPLGPWKLQGLPGLILEGEEVNGKVRFFFERLEMPLEVQAHIQRPNTRKTMTWKAFQAKQKKILEKLVKADRAQQMMEGFDGNLSYEISEPIELEE